MRAISRARENSMTQSPPYPPPELLNSNAARARLFPLKNVVVVGALGEKLFARSIEGLKGRRLPLSFSHSLVRAPDRVFLALQASCVQRQRYIQNDFASFADVIPEM